jgi:hypothetical protein
MKIFIKTFTTTILASLFILSSINIKAQDTINVQTFTYGSSQDSFFLFPPDTNRYEKILMHYNLKCNPNQNPACGQWDYLTYTYYYQHTHTYDSTLLSAPSFTWDGNSPDSIPYMNTPSYSYFPVWHYSIVYDSIYFKDTAVVGTGAINSVHPFNSSNPQSRTQYLWKTSELLAAGMHAGKITNLRFNVLSTGSTMADLMIRIKNSTLDSLVPAAWDTGGFATTFNNNLTFASTGWNTINLTYPFNWDGVSNLVIDISYTNDNAGVDNTILADSVNFQAGVFSAGDDRSYRFSEDQVNVPYSAFTTLDSFITIAFWGYGDPLVQPQNNSAFEALDSLGQRVLNFHLPWSDGNFYWDAGNSGTGNYDRINALATAAEYKGKWNYYTLTKNVATGKMKIYVNGNMFLTGNLKTKLMTGIRKFDFGSGDQNDFYYGGNLDEFAVWNAELDTHTIKAYMYKDIDANHPYNANLLLYYHCNDHSFTTCSDSSGHGNNGTLIGPPPNPQIQGMNLFRNFVQTNARPFIVFEQDSFSSHIDTTITVDSVENTPIQIVQYLNFSNPTVPTDTLLKWQSYYNNYVYNNQGVAIDSSYVTPDSILYLIHTPYYSAPFEIVNRFEIARFITPYGINMTLGANGFTWTEDVSDYATLLHDTVYLSSGNWQEYLNVSFEMITGIPPRDPISVRNIWNGGPGYNGIQNFLVPKTLFIDTNEYNTRLKLRVTGHGEDVQNCLEFCPKYHYLYIDSVLDFTQLVWRHDCSFNPLYPQGGTWIYNRANWCPGAPVYTYNYEYTPFVTPGDSATFEYYIDPYQSGEGGGAYYSLETQLISYGHPNFTLDAAVYDIVSPSKANIYNRRNPICSNPVVIIQNTGSDTLTSLTITYGIEGATQSAYHWTGSLPFMDTTTVQLGQFSWGNQSNKFQVTVSSPNGGIDQYPNNNSMESTYNFPPEYPNQLIFDLLTDAHLAQYGTNEDSYTITDETGTIVWQRTNSQILASTTYRDTLNLPTGCYEFKFEDDLGGTSLNDPNYNEGDGMTNWPDQTNTVGHMFIRRMSNQVLKNFATSDGWDTNPNGMDFGHEMYFQFTVGYYLNVPQIKYDDIMTIYPNPSKGIFNLDMSFNEQQDVTVSVFDMMGNKVFDQNLKNVSAEINQIDLSNQPDGIYFITAQSKDKRIARKIVKSE